jgi:hypothetical protein
MADDKSLCPYCKGSRFIKTGYTEKIVNGRRSLYPYALPCYCDLNRSINKKFGMLSTLPDVTPEDSIKIFDRYGVRGPSIGNYIFYGDEPSFLYTVKSYFLRVFTHQIFELLEGLTIVDKYNRPGSDHEGRLTISVLDQYDLVVILFTSKSEPPTLKACVADVVKNRLRVRKPTWIFSQSKSLDTTKEHSKDLAPFLEIFEYVESTSVTNYTGFSRGVSDKVVAQKNRSLQDSLGSI